MQKTKIEWTDFTSNPIGIKIDGIKKGWMCSKVSPGCQNCYSETLNFRYGNKLEYNKKNADKVEFYLRETELAAWNALKVPSKIFIEDMSDLFHERVSEKLLFSVFDAMLESDWHTYQLLTKRPERMKEFFAKTTIWVTKNLKDGRTFLGYRTKKFPHNIWIGTSVEMALYKDRIKTLAKCRGDIKFLSCEPLLGPLGKLDLRSIDWVIAGGESGPGHRPMNIDWVREIRDQCEARDVPFFFKQHGGARPGGPAFLDGKEWKQFPN